MSQKYMKLIVSYESSLESFLNDTTFTLRDVIKRELCVIYIHLFEKKRGPK